MQASIASLNKPPKNQTMVEHYNDMVQSGRLASDEDQKRVLDTLSALNDAILRGEKERKSFFSFLNSKKESNCPDGIYIYGSVGRGKSMLMDLFFLHCPIIRKTRIHFHAFMLDIHEKIHKKRQESNYGDDPIEYVADEIAKKSQLLCFDELQVTDIADAMIIGRLFDFLFKRGVIVVATSNRHPDDLYKHGLQREQFMPFIKMFKEKLYITPLDGETDYRMRCLKSLSTVYYSPIDDTAQIFLDDSFSELTQYAQSEEGELHIHGRTLKIKKMHADVAQFSFDELCKEALGAADYIEIAREFNTILISDIPKMGKEMRNEAKRFITLIDELYEHKVKLICTAQCPPNELYSKGDNAFEFDRTVSRLIEMQSDGYFSEGHIG